VYYFNSVDIIASGVSFPGSSAYIYLGTDWKVIDTIVEINH
jgi:hypothetical protein